MAMETAPSPSPGPGPATGSGAGAGTGATVKPKQRVRSSIACRMCHARRVKCNAAERMPCSNCERAKCDCRLIESKRGRKKKLTPSTPTASGLLDPNVPNEQSRRPPGPPQGPKKNREELHLTIPDVKVQNVPRLERSLAPPRDPDTLYAQMLDQAGAPRQIVNNTEIPRQIVSNTETPRQMHNSSETPSPGRNITKAGGQVVYLGETFNLTYLLQQTNLKTPQDAYKLHYVLPIDPKKNLTKQRREEDTATLELLGHQGAFLIPPTEICLELYRVYFKYIHPHYPILDRRDFATRYANPTNPPSYLLLQAVFFMAAGHCDVSLLHNAGFKSRYEARLTLFKRTKALYDADHETDKVTIVQALFLMSFWWNSPTDQKDTYHWLGNAISLALTLGMHRSTAHSDMPLKEQRLWKKIWWSLFTEDKHAAAALGRPAHVHLRDTDVEPLDESDFQEESGPDQHIYGVQERIDVLYVLALSDLSKIVERIIEQSFNAHGQVSSKQADTLESCEELLQDWETRLPNELRLGRCGESIWTSMLHIAHSWFRVLTHRARTPEDPSTPSQHASYKLAMNAADRIVRILEDLLSTSSIQQCPIHIIPALFAAMGMHAVNICSGDVVLEQLGYVKIRMSMIALRELQNTWPVSGWIFLLFTRIVRRIRNGEDNPDDPSSVYSDSRRNTNMTDYNAPPDGDRMSISMENTRSPNSFRHSAPNFSYPQDHQSNPDSSFAAWNAQRHSMPLNFSMDWSSLEDGDFWPDPEFDFMVGNPTSPRIG